MSDQRLSNVQTMLVVLRTFAIQVWVFDVCACTFAFPDLGVRSAVTVSLYPIRREHIQQSAILSSWLPVLEICCSLGLAARIPTLRTKWPKVVEQ
jgi:hypothetical protein